MAIRPKPRPWWRHWLTDPLEGGALYGAYRMFKSLSVDRASDLGSRIGRTIGPRTGMHRIAARNLARALPETSPAERTAILDGMWDNLGRNMGEFPHVETIWRDGRIELAGDEEAAECLRSQRPLLFFSGHLANWEAGAFAAIGSGIAPVNAYRVPNNRFADRLVRRVRPLAGLTHVEKGADGGRAIFQVMRQGGAVNLMMDQKLNDGIEVPFFGRPAMTAPALARLALLFKCPVLPVRVERLGGAHFRVTGYAPIRPVDTGDRDADTLAFTERVNRILEGWIRERPEQWLWIHRRWRD